VAQYAIRIAETPTEELTMSEEQKFRLEMAEVFSDVTDENKRAELIEIQVCAQFDRPIDRNALNRLHEQSAKTYNDSEYMTTNQGKKLW